MKKFMTLAMITSALSQFNVHSMHEAPIEGKLVEMRDPIKSSKTESQKRAEDYQREAQTEAAKQAEANKQKLNIKQQADLLNQQLSKSPQANQISGPENKTFNNNGTAVEGFDLTPQAINIGDITLFNESNKPIDLSENRVTEGSFFERLSDYTARREGQVDPIKVIDKLVTIDDFFQNIDTGQIDVSDWDGADLLKLYEYSDTFKIIESQYKADPTQLKTIDMVTYLNDFHTFLETKNPESNFKVDPTGKDLSRSSMQKFIDYLQDLIDFILGSAQGSIVIAQPVKEEYIINSSKPDYASEQNIGSSFSFPTRGENLAETPVDLFRIDQTTTPIVETDESQARENTISTIKSAEPTKTISTAPADNLSNQPKVTKTAKGNTRTETIITNKDGSQKLETVLTNKNGKVMSRDYKSL